MGTIDEKDLEIARLRGRVEALEKLVVLLIPPQQPVPFFPMPAVQPAPPYVPPMYPYGPGIQPWDVTPMWFKDFSMCAAPPPNMGEVWVGETMAGHMPSILVGSH